VPRQVAASFAAGRAVIDKYPQVINQIVLADFMAAGHFDRHIRRMRKSYDRKRLALLEAIDKEIGGLIELGPSDSGMHICAYLPDGIPDTQVAHAAEQRGIELLPLSEFYPGTERRNGLILGYTAIPLAHIAEGVKLLRQTIEDVSKAPAHSSH
jgi:GntR family transcriptional regulator / MocR family aminotransferase